MKDSHELYMTQQRNLASKLREVNMYMCAELAQQKHELWYCGVHTSTRSAYYMRYSLPSICKKFESFGIVCK